MHKNPVIVVFDIGKTNKKLFVLDARYNILQEEASSFYEIADEDGDPCEDIHALTAHAYAAVTENAARTVEVDHGGPLLLLTMVLRLRVKAVGSAVLEGHVLQLALAAGIAYRAVERMVAKQ